MGYTPGTGCKHSGYRSQRKFAYCSGTRDEHACSYDLFLDTSARMISQPLHSMEGTRLSIEGVALVTSLVART